MMSFLAMSFVISGMAASELGSRNDLVGTERAISVLFGINGVRNK